MSDFAQSGLICTLQRLNDTHLEALESDLEQLALSRPIALILPCHGADLEKPALQHIVDELRGAKFLREIVVSMNSIDAAGWVRAERIFARLNTRITLLWNDRKPGAARRERGPVETPPLIRRALEPRGKGGNVAAAFRHLAASGECAIYATQDCDVTSFRRRDLARLCLSLADSRLGYRFAKMYYSRVTDRLYGRVSRLFLAPLLQALLRVAGHQPLLDFLLSFRYPLSGETALTRELAAALPEPSGWSLEIGQLCAIFRQLDPREACQVDGGTGYDHKHQTAGIALAVMAREIASELFHQCALEGMPGSDEFRAEIAAAYRREADLALHRSASLAIMNRLPFDESGERAIVEIFAEQLSAL